MRSVSPSGIKASISKQKYTYVYIVEDWIPKDEGDKKWHDMQGKGGLWLGC